MACRLAPARVVALAAMLLQVLFYADHIGATAVAEIGRAPPGARLGLLQICTGEGIVWRTPDGKVAPASGSAPVQHSHSSSDCAVCSSASVCGFDAPMATALVPFAADLVVAPVLSLQEAAPPVLRRHSAHAIRAPPIG